MKKSPLYDMICNFYKNGKIDEHGLDKAVNLGWIREDEKQMILSSVK